MYTGAVKCGLCKYIVYLYILPALLIMSRVVYHQVTRLQELTYGSTSFPLGDAKGSTNWRLYATTGTISSPLVKTGHIRSDGPNCNNSQNKLPKCMALSIIPFHSILLANAIYRCRRKRKNGVYSATAALIVCVATTTTDMPVILLKIKENQTKNLQYAAQQAYAPPNWNIGGLA